MGECDELLARLDEFWERPYPHSLLKHSLLRGYLPVFATKTASRHRERRAVFVDGYAGAGRYRSGDPGSPLIAIEVAEQLAGYNKPQRLDCLFVERDLPTFEAMDCLVDGRGRTIHGDLRNHLPTALELTGDAPLFMFLDPYGFLPSLEVLVSDVLQRDRMAPRRQPTELLVSLMTFTVNRQAGVALRATHHTSSAGTARALDGFMGGPWWRDVVNDWRLTDAERDEQLAHRWARTIEERAPGYQAWPVAVPQRWAEAGYYYLVLVTAHDQGGWFFANQLQKSLVEFYKAVTGNQPQLLGPDYRTSEAPERMRRNLQQLLADKGEFVMGQMTRELYEDALGWGGLKELVDVVKQLQGAGELEVIEGKATQADLHKCRVRASATMSLGI